MAPSLNSYMDSLSNPETHFRTLRGILPVAGADGRPAFRVFTHAVNFDVEWNGERYWLKCFTCHSDAVRNRARLVCAQFSSIQSPYLTGCAYLDAEIAVSDNHIIPSMHDVVMQKVPDGKPLDHFLSGACDRENRRALKRLAENLCAMAAWLSAKGILHRNIKPSNVYVTRDAVPVLVNYDFAEKTAGNGPLPGHDNRALAAVAMGLHLLAGRPELYRRLGKRQMFSPSSAEQIARQVLASRPTGCLGELAGMIAEGVPSRTALDECLARLADLEAEPGKIPPVTLAAAEPVAAPPARTPDLSEYTGHGDTCETLTRVCGRDGKWLYLDMDGNPAGEGRYDRAEDFAEGRAAVETGGRGALIDKEGAFIIPPVFDSVEWDPWTGIATVSVDGLLGLYDRCGNKLTEVQYDWISCACEGLILAQAGDKYGFLDCEGRIAIGFDFDEAASFSGGVAPVRIAGRSFHIDKTGQPVNAVPALHD